MEERVSGFRVRGTWDDVVGHGERLTSAMEEFGADAELLKEWDDWRPKSHESREEEMSQKTVEQASLDEGAGERVGEAAREDVQRASERAIESIEKVEGDGPEDVLENWREALQYGLRATDTGTRKTIRMIETPVYEQLMTRFTPYYFDNELVSANTRQAGRLEDGDEFIFEANVNDVQLKEAVSERLETAERTQAEHS